MNHENVTTKRTCMAALTALVALFFAAAPLHAATGVQLEAESGTLGANMEIAHFDGALGAGNGEIIRGTGSSPGSQPNTADNLATYTVDFPAAGEYDLYVRFVLQTNDGSDSILVAQDFGEPSLTDAALWALQNSLAVGKTKLADMPVVDGGLASDYPDQSLIWINFSAVFTDPAIAGVQTDSDEPVPTYIVDAAGPHTFQISQREPGGIQVDAIAFALTSEAGEVFVDDDGNLPFSRNQAKNPNPENEAVFVPVTGTVLSWEAPEEPNDDIVTYDVYFGTAVPDANCDGNPQVASDQLATTHDPGTLAFDTTYYWRVDVIDPNTPGTPFTVRGKCWSFSTCTAAPIILEDPQGLTVNSGDDAVFTVNATCGVTTYQWKKDGNDLSNGGNISGADTDTLTITNVQLADEGDYSVEVSNDADSDTSAEAQLLTCRLVAHWPLDGNLNDVVGGFNGTVAPTAGSGADFITGIDGQAYHFTGDPNTANPNLNSNYVLITGGVNPDSYFNFATRGFSVSLWVRDAASTTFEGLVSKAVGRTDGWTLDVGTGNGGEADMRYRIAGASGGSGINVGSDLSLVDSNWHHVVGVFDAAAGEARIYQDGVLRNTDTDAGGFVATAAAVVLGAEDPDGDFAFEGDLDDVRIYSCPLKPTQVATLYTDFGGGAVCVFDTPEEDVSEFDFNSDCVIDVLDFADWSTWFLNCNLVPSSACQ